MKISPNSEYVSVRKDAEQNPAVLIDLNIKICNKFNVAFTVLYKALI